MSGRYSRDELISIALELLDASTLTQHDMKGGIVSSNAYSIKWLNEALDSYHLRYPFSGDITAVDMVIDGTLSYMTLATSPQAFLPDDFMLDCRDGVILQQSSGFTRLFRGNFQTWLDTYNATFNMPQNTPRSYAIWQGKIQLAPVPSVGYTAILWYYARPALLTATDRPDFPDEYVLIDFIRIKGLERLNQAAPGTARQYMQKEMARLRSIGLLHDAEEERMHISQSIVGDGSEMNRNRFINNIVI